MANKLTAEEMTSLLKQRCAEDPKYANIANRLRELFWDSTCNDINLRLYDRLQDEAIVHGEPVYRCIKSVAGASISANNPVRYFASSITRRLREHGYLQDAGDELNL